MGGEHTLAVPNRFGSSLSFNAPGPMLGKHDERTISFPPICVYKALVSIAARKDGFRNVRSTGSLPAAQGPSQTPFQTHEPHQISPQTYSAARPRLLDNLAG